jgi:hypothetical protein
MTAPARMVPPALAVVEKNSAEEIRVSRTEFKGHDLIDIRVFGRFGGPAAVFMPTKKGLTIQVGQLTAFIDALHAAREAIGGAH